MFLPSRVKARVPYTGDRFSVSLLERRRVLLFHWTARGSGSIGETLFVLKCRLDGAHSPPGERGPWLTTTSPPPAPVLAAPRSQRVLQLPHPTLLWGTWEWQSIRWQPGRGGHEACSGHGRTVPSENSRSFPAPHTVPAPAGGGELEGSVSALSPPPEASGPRPGMHREIGLGSERPGHGGRAGHRGRPATPREGGFGAPAGTSEFKGWTPRPQNGALFGNRVTAGVISSDEVILGGGQSNDSIFIRRGHLGADARRVAQPAWQGFFPQRCSHSELPGHRRSPPLGGLDHSRPRCYLLSLRQESSRSATAVGTSPPRALADVLPFSAKKNI